MGKNAVQPVMSRHYEGAYQVMDYLHLAQNDLAIRRFSECVDMYLVMNSDITSKWGG